MNKNMFKDFNWDDVISKNEKKELEFGISQSYAVALLLLISASGIIVVFSNILVGLAIILLGGVYFLYLTKGKHYLFTDNRIILVDAFIGKEVVSVDFDQITDIEMEQSPVDQIGGWGTLTINTAGTHAPEIRLTFVNNPQKIKQELDIIRAKKTS